jgi:hypothetical protein
MLILFFAVGLTACNDMPSRTEAEQLLRHQLGNERLYSSEKGPDGAKADFALDHVSGITRPDANTIRIDFMFHWVPTNEHAKQVAERDDKVPNACRWGVSGPVWGDLSRWCVPISDKVIATAVFEKYDDGWRLKRVYA